MSFTVAVQSAVFYFLACTPCAKVRHRKKARQDAKKERAERARLETEQPNLYRHPSPFNTNPYWDEEITMGPSLPKKGGSKNTSQRRLTSAGHESRGGSTSAVNSLDTSSSPTMVAEDARTTFSMSVADSADWNHKRYQREDEELWGHDIAWAGHKLMDAIAKAGSAAGRVLDGRLGREKAISEEDRENFYFSPKNPPVNDYHPPVVSNKPLHRDGYKWMLQPPPPAKVMEGKVPVSRTASQTSMASRRTIGSHGDAQEAPLSRLVSKKLVEGKIRKGELPEESEMTILTRPTSRRTATSSTIQGKSLGQGGRSRSLSTESQTSTDSILERRRKKRAAQHAARRSEFNSEEEDDEVKVIDGIPTRHAVQRPKLPTITSGDAADENTNTLQPTTTADLPPSGSESTPKESSSTCSPIEHKRPTGVSIDSGLALS